MLFANSTSALVFLALDVTTHACEEAEYSNIEQFSYPEIVVQTPEVKPNSCPGDGDAGETLVYFGECVPFES